MASKRKPATAEAVVRLPVTDESVVRMINSLDDRNCLKLADTLYAAFKAATPEVKVDLATPRIISRTPDHHYNTVYLMGNLAGRVLADRETIPGAIVQAALPLGKSHEGRKRRPSVAFAKTYKAHRAKGRKDAQIAVLMHMGPDRFKKRKRRARDAGLL